jgi:PAS domain S-box-containing protein
VRKKRDGERKLLQGKAILSETLFLGEGKVRSRLHKGIYTLHFFPFVMPPTLDSISDADLRKRFQAIFNNTFQFMFLATVDGVVIEMNQAAVNFTGIRSPEAVGQVLWELPCWHDADRAKLQASVYRASGGEFIRYTGEIVNLDAARAVIDLSIKPTFSASSGDIDFFVIEGRDITAIKRLEFERDRERNAAETLHKLSELKNEFVSQVSHELRTPLASIIGFAQTLLRSPQIDAEKAQQFLTIILEDGRRLERLVEDLLDISRIESGNMVLLRQTVDVAAMLHYAQHIIAAEAAFKRITVHHTYAPDAPATLLLDNDRITQVFVNLLANAVKFTSPGGEIFIRTTLQQHSEQNALHSPHLVIAISDTGVGIAADDVPRLFEKFFRARQRDTKGTEIPGTGLGLAIAKQIVEQHGGTITVHSNLGEGSTFTVILPLD